MNNTFNSRINKLQANIENNQSVLLSSASDVTYFTNFNFLLPEEREAFAFITKNSISLIYTSFSPIDNFSFINYLKGSYPNQLASHLEKIIIDEKINTILIDDETLFVAELSAIKDKIKDLSIKNYDLNLIRNLRNIKEPYEIENIKIACEVTAQVIEEIKSELKEGITEKEVKILIDRLLEKHGVDELAFPTIVAFGSNTALPHHQPSGKLKVEPGGKFSSKTNDEPGDEPNSQVITLENNMPVLIDMGAKVAGYCADMTRTFWFGDQPSDKFLEIESIVKNAYSAALGVLKDGSDIESSDNANKIIAKDVDGAARTIITNKGYANYFIHTTGHGLGLSIHEQPSLSWSNTTQILPNMTVTIEPGIYLKEEFGYRYENTVLVTKINSIELTNPKKDL